MDVSNVYAGVAAQIREVKVEEGDQVEAGDVIAVLDSSEVEYNIAVQEATLNEAELTDSYNIKDSQTSLDNLNEQLDSGLNSHDEYGAGNAADRAAELSGRGGNL